MEIETTYNIGWRNDPLAVCMNVATGFLDKWEAEEWIKKNQNKKQYKQGEMHLLTMRKVIEDE